MPTFLADAGVLAMPQGAPVIDHHTSADLKVAASIDLFVFAIDHQLTDGDRNERDQQYL
jgi:hypothetical protein